MKPSGLLWERGNLWFLILALPGLLANKRAKWLFDHKHKTSCQTGTPMTPVLEGDPSVITCHFSEDLRLWKLDFGVIRHDLDGFDPLGDLILSCTWDLGKDNPSCIGKGSEQVKLAASGNETTLDIPNTQKEHTGRYSCRYALSWPDDEGHCTLAVAGQSIFCSVPHATISVGAFSTITCHFHSDLLQTREKFHVYRFGEDGSQPVEVAYCTWNVRYANGKPSCVEKPGYHLDTTNIGTSATLQIGSAVEMHSGRYSCRTIPANENVKVIDCTLSVKGTTSMTTTRPAQRQPDQYSDKFVREGQSTSVTCFFPKNIDSHITQIGVKRVINKGTSSNESEQVLQCNESSPCHKTEGYDLADKGTQTFTVTITNFTEQQEGIYVCTFKAKDIESKIPTVCLHLSKDAPDPRLSRSRAAQTYQSSLTVAMAACYRLCVMMF